MNLLDQFRLRPTITGFGGGTIPIGGQKPMGAGPFIPPASSPAILPTNTPLNPPATGQTQIQKAQQSPVGLDEYRTFLGNQPRREDYQLNKWGKLLAGIAGSAEGYNRGVREGINVGKGLLDRPYEEAKEDWQTKGGRLKELYELGRTERGEARAEEELGIKKSDLAIRQDENTRQGLELNDRLQTTALQRDEIRQGLLSGKYEGFQSNGHYYTRDKTTNEIVDRGKIGETAAEARAADHNYFEKRFSLDLFGDEEKIRLQGSINQALQNARIDADHSLARLNGQIHRENTEHDIRVDPRQQDTAFAGAVTEFGQTYPGAAAALFDENGQPRIDPTTGQSVDPELFSKYSRWVRSKTNEKLGIPTSYNDTFLVPASDKERKLMEKAQYLLRSKNKLVTEESTRRAMRDIAMDEAKGVMYPDPTAPGNIAVQGVSPVPVNPTQGVPNVMLDPSVLTNIRTHQPIIPPNPLIRQRGATTRY